jgi:hypothetical protein
MDEKMGVRHYRRETAAQSIGGNDQKFPRDRNHGLYPRTPARTPERPHWAIEKSQFDKTDPHNIQKDKKSIMEKPK